MNIINKILWRLNLNLSIVYPRPSIRFMKDYFKDKEVVGAEIGIYTGGNAKSILQTLNIKKLYLVDAYKSYEGYVGKRFEEAERKAINNVSFWKNKVKFIKKMSADAINEIPKLDFIYIDGNHTYEYIKQDLENYFGKIKQGGIMAGHDFYFENSDVIKAVIEFCSEKKLKLFVGDKDWWVVLEKEIKSFL